MVALKMLFKNPALNSVLISIIIVAGAGIVVVVAPHFSYVKYVSTQQINANPQAFKDVRLCSQGYIVNTSDYVWGANHFLRDNDSMVALGWKSGFNITSLQRYVSFVLGGRGFTQLRDLIVWVKGYLRYVGFVVDAPSHYIEIEDLGLQAARWDMDVSASQQARVEVDKVNYSVGEPVRFRAFQKNLNIEPVHGGVGEISINVLNVLGEHVFSMSKFITWAPDFVLSPMEEVEFSSVLLSWNQTNSKGTQVSPGTYTIEIELNMMGKEVTLWLKITIIIL